MGDKQSRVSDPNPGNGDDVTKLPSEAVQMQKRRVGRERRDDSDDDDRDGVGRVVFRPRRGRGRGADGDGDGSPPRPRRRRNKQGNLRKKGGKDEWKSASSDTDSSSEGSDWNSRSSSSDNSEAQAGKGRPRRRRPPPNPSDKWTEEKLLAEVFEFLMKREGMTASMEKMCKELKIKPSDERLVKALRECESLEHDKKSKRVKVNCSLKSCERYVEVKHGDLRGCPGLDCGAVHICIQYLNRTCDKMGEECRYGHDLRQTERNCTLLWKSGVAALPDRLIEDLLCRTLLKQIDCSAGGLPAICEDYNSPGGCRFGDSVCGKFHICLRYILDQDGLGGACDGSPAKCRLNHKARKGNVLRLLDVLGFEINYSEKELMGEFKRRMRKSGWKPQIKPAADQAPQKQGLKVRLKPSGAGTTLSNLTEDGNVKVQTVCLGYLNGSCLGSCPKGALHGSRPYQWQVKDYRSNRDVWYNFPLDASDALEDSYVDETIGQEDLPDIDPARIGPAFANLVSLLGISAQKPSSGWTAMFDQLTLVDSSAGKALKLRRLSTPSSVNCKDQWATRWRWLFKDRQGKWMEYGAQTPDTDGKTIFTSSVTSDDVEKAYQDYVVNNGPSLLKFNTAGYPYELYFDRTTFIQKNMDERYKTEREIRRRPTPFPSLPSGIHLSGQGPGVSIDAGPAADSIYPRTWTSLSAGKSVPTLNPVKMDSSEAQVILKAITKDFKLRPFVKLERIESPIVYDMHLLAKDRLLRLYKGNKKALNKKHLLHPAHQNEVPQLVKELLDWRNRQTVPFLTGAYGQGVYCYGPGANLGSPAPGQVWIMVEAFAGSACQGSQGMRYAADNQATNFKFECAVDNVANPTVFVFFDFDLVYQSYVLTF